MHDIRELISPQVVQVTTQTEADWKAERNKGIGGSDLTSLIGGDNYACERKLAYSKTIPEDYSSDSFALQRGKRLEPVARDNYENKTGRTVLHGFGTFVHKDASHRRVNVDGLFTVDGARLGLAEFKVLGDESFKKVKSIGLPQSYLAQGQWGAGLLGADLVSYGIFKPLDEMTDNPEGEFLVIDMPFDRQVFDALVSLVDEFWRNLNNGNLPTQLADGHFACKYCPYRKTCKNLGSNGKQLKGEPRK